jgi:hypothetical protein
MRGEGLKKSLAPSADQVDAGSILPAQTRHRLFERAEQLQAAVASACNGARTHHRQREWSLGGLLLNSGDRSVDLKSVSASASRI